MESARKKIQAISTRAKVRRVWNMTESLPGAFFSLFPVISLSTSSMT